MLTLCQRYHSIQARGERVEDVLRAEEERKAAAEAEEDAMAETPDIEWRSTEPQGQQAEEPLEQDEDYEPQVNLSFCFVTCVFICYIFELLLSPV